MNILANQCKYPGIYSESFCLGCSKDNDNVNDNDLRRSFDNSVNDNVNDDDNVNDNLKENVNDNNNYSVIDNDNDKDNVKDNDNDNVNDNVNQGTCFADDNLIYQFDKKHQKSKPNNTPTSNNSVNMNEDLQSWLNDDDIITEATFPDNFRCIISGPSECGKTFLLKKN